MPSQPNQRSSYEVAAQWGVSLADLVGDGKTSDARLTKARKAYKDGVEDGSVAVDPPPTGPSVE